MNALLEIGLSNAVQAAILVPAAALVGWCLRRRPAVVHALWVLVLLKLVTPSLVRVEVPWTASAAELPATTVAFLPAGVPPSHGAPALATQVEPAPPRVAKSPPLSGRHLVATIWLGGAAVFWGLALTRMFQFRRILRAGAPDAEIRERVVRLAERMGLPQVPEVLLVPARISPMIWAPGRKARLLLPADLWDELPVAQQDAILAHELAHLRRGDPWVRRLELLVGGLYWWHPAVWWARREIEAAEEQCCDAWVTWALPESAEAYAAALLSTVTYLSGHRPPLPAGASGVGHVRTLKRRLAMIVHGTTTGAAARALPRAALLVGAVALLWLPTWANGDPQDRKGGKSPKTERLPKPVKTTTPQAEPSPPPGKPGPNEPAADKPAPEDVFAAMGSVQLVRSLTLSPAVAGRVANVHVDVGSTVKKGDLLVELDAERAKVEVDRARAKYQAHKESLEFAAQLVKNGTSPPSEAKRAEMELRVAQADLQLAEIALQGMRIVAPMDGTVLRWQAQVGQNVAVAQPLGELADLRRVEAVVQLSPRDVSLIAVGRRCRIKVQDTDDVYQGSVRRIDPVVDSTRGTINVYVTIDPPEKGDPPRPGSLVRVEYAGKQ